eukprot:366052-Chlamydomonas_euryale.AAC.16
MSTAPSLPYRTAAAAGGRPCCTGNRPLLRSPLAAMCSCRSFRPNLSCLPLPLCTPLQLP